MSGSVLWFTGMSGSGKTTIANRLAEKLGQKGKAVKILDGDVIRNSVHRHLGFAPEDIRENNVLIAKLCLKYKKGHNFVLVPIISPFAESRAKAKEIIGEGFIEVYVKISLAEAIKRDVKGLYEKVLSGGLKNFIGISPNVPYEPPGKPDICIDTEGLAVNDSIELVYNYLEERNLVGGL